MEKINISEILRNYRKGTKLYSPCLGNVTLYDVDMDEDTPITIDTVDESPWGLDKYGKLYEHGECMLFPSKEMRDWEKFQWKKGDILTATDGTIAIFDGWVDNDYYVLFTAKYSIEYNGDNTISIKENNNYFTEIFQKSKESEKNYFIKKVEECYGGRLNLETLEIEKPFDALDKEGKTWDGGKNVVVDLPKKECELKPFDRVLVRDYIDRKWVIDIFSHTYKNRAGQTIYSCISSSYFQCIHYNDQTKHLFGTTDEWKGGEI